jgi:hypothetical protein
MIGAALLEVHWTGPNDGEFAGLGWALVVNRNEHAERDGTKSATTEQRRNGLQRIIVSIGLTTPAQSQD